MRLTVTQREFFEKNWTRLIAVAVIAVASATFGARTSGVVSFTISIAGSGLSFWIGIDSMIRMKRPLERPPSILS
jgi:hypothetical protein